MGADHQHVWDEDADCLVCGTDLFHPDGYMGEDDDDSEACSWCGGEWYLQECDDPIQCCEPRCDGTWHPCSACQGTGVAKHQIFW